MNLPEFTGNWAVDNFKLVEYAEVPRTAAQYIQHSEMVKSLFNRLAWGTPEVLHYPMRKGFARSVYDEIIPIAHFAKLHFVESSNVTIRWYSRNQNFDATVDDQRAASERSSIKYLEVTTLQDWGDAKQLQELSEKSVIRNEGDLEYENHLRKVDLLKVALEKKGAKVYPPDTALLVYTDENRFEYFSIGSSSLSLYKKNNFGAVLDEMKQRLGGFSEVFVYSHREIYCALQLSPK